MHAKDRPWKRFEQFREPDVDSMSRARPVRLVLALLGIAALVLLAIALVRFAAL